MLQDSNFPSHLRIAALLAKNTITPYLEKTEEGNYTYILDAFVIPLLQQVLGFSYEIVIAEDNNFGKKGDDGNWTGLVGLIQREEADIAIGLIITIGRSSVVDFSYPYDYTDLTFVTDKPEKSPKSFAIFNPFSWQMWLALALCLIFMTCLLFAFVRQKYKFSAVLISSYGILLENALDFKITASSVRILMMSWIIGALFITNSYKAVLLAFLTFPTETGIRNAKELSEASKVPSFRCHTFPGSFAYNIISEADDELLGPIGKCIKRNPFEFMSHEEFLSVPNVKKAAITSRRYIFRFELPYFLSEDSLFFPKVGIAISKKFCCKNTINDIIHRLFDAGLFQKYSEDVEFFSILSSISHAPTDSNGIEKLTLNDIAGAFYILKIGYGLAAVVFVMEFLLCDKKQRKRIYRKYLFKMKNPFKGLSNTSIVFTLLEFVVL